MNMNMAMNMKIKMKMKQFKVLRFFPLLLLTGCSVGMNDDFTCSSIDGFEGCPTMNEVHTLADNGYFDTDSKGNVKSKIKGRLTNTWSDNINSTNNNGNGNGNTINTPIAGSVNAPLYSGTPKRYKEEIKEIVIYPYQDSKGNYHDTALIYTVLSPPVWLAKPPRDIINSRYN